MLKFFAHPTPWMRACLVQYMGKTHDNGGEPEWVYVQSSSVHMTVITMWLSIEPLAIEYETKCTKRKQWVRQSKAIGYAAAVQQARHAQSMDIWSSTCILQDTYTEVAWTDQALLPSLITCYSPHRCGHWSMWQALWMTWQHFDRWNLLAMQSPITLAIE